MKINSQTKMINQSLVLLFCWLMCILHGDAEYDTGHLTVDVSSVGRPIPDTLFGVFFEEINHAGAGGVWAELVANRGFEAGGWATPSNIDPWSIIGDEKHIIVGTDRSSCFDRNKVALRMDVFCDNGECPSGGVGVSNPGYWGMNIRQGQRYKVVFYVRSNGSVDMTVSFVDQNSHQNLISANYVNSSSNVANWTRVEMEMEAKISGNGSLQLTTTKKGTIWIDQVSAMPVDTYSGHGFRTDLVEMVSALKPKFMRFPGGCYVEGQVLRNAFRWKETVGPWENRPGHKNDVWKYWTDDGLGFLELLQFAEDVNALPLWVFNNGISHDEQVATANIVPFVQEALDGIEFAKGDAKSTYWGSKRAEMGHPEPFDLRYVSIGNEDCWKPYYTGNYRKFYDAIKQAYPEIMIVSNCDATLHRLDHPADFYDYHLYPGGDDMFRRAHAFDAVSRSGPKAFVSEYAVFGKETGKTGTLLAAVAEAAFLIGLEKNSDIVAMASYAPLFVNDDDRQWSPDAIVFNSVHVYGTPSYWMQQFFIESSGGTLLNATLSPSSPASITASAITWKTPGKNDLNLKIKIANFDMNGVNLKISIDGLDREYAKMTGTKTVLTGQLMDENSFQEPRKVAPVQTQMNNAGRDMDLSIPPNSITSIDLPISSKPVRIGRSKMVYPQDHP